MYKVKHNLCPKLFQNLFTPAIRGSNEWIIPKVRTVNKGDETIRHRDPKTWELVPEEIKNSKTLFTFKENIKKWKPPGCTCRLYKTYVKGLGYL